MAGSEFDRLESALEGENIGSRLPAPDMGMRKAAVLILLTNEPDPKIILTLRATHLRKHAGQISFPGGSRDGTETPEQTALREAREECGIDPEGVRLLGRLPASSLPVTSYAVTPVIGVWDSPEHLELLADPAEVAGIYRVPVSALANPENRGTWVWGELGHTEKQPANAGSSGPAFVYGDLVIWGFTAMLIDSLLELAGWQQPWDRGRTVAMPMKKWGSTSS
ncbi:8-oxo-dGTP pyrophosphatase MutT (NUDIX family) [Trueperella bonasi]|uniref:8-oxo-dGTP pyrophosphatase MutT (NUDIX family) n=1 Tax=Trueperella bonasi TaxID=312286 RepID=A0ABT9NI96_9ACTO|nr:CoA pyrophosphatase [Trueperella bonasi]MDP9806538.1 8-oxo-dGTP pyrophosphatase MutT (NUDIX family) [Trueperella bonasi]